MKCAVGKRQVKSEWKCNFLHSLVDFHRKTKRERLFWDWISPTLSFLGRKWKCHFVCVQTSPATSHYLYLCMCERYLPTHADVHMCAVRLTWMCDMLFYAKCCQWQIAIKDWRGKWCLAATKNTLAHSLLSQSVCCFANVQFVFLLIF